MILFLDFDGVLHPESVYRINGQPTLVGPGALFQHAGVLVEILAPHPEVKIVLSTSWVSILGFDRTRAYLPPALDNRVVGATYHTQAKDWWHQATRYDQIARYVRLKRPGNWVAIDDDAIGWPDALLHQVVQTDPKMGLGDPATQQALTAALN